MNENSKVNIVIKLVQYTEMCKKMFIFMSIKLSWKSYYSGKEKLTIIDCFSHFWFLMDDSPVRVTSYFKTTYLCYNCCGFWFVLYYWHLWV